MVKYYYIIKFCPSKEEGKYYVVSSDTNLDYEDCLCYESYALNTYEEALERLQQLEKEKK